MKKRIVLFSLVLLSFSVLGQVGINTAGGAPDQSAMLDVESTSKGFLPPRMTTEQRDNIQNPASGLIIFNTDNSCLNMWDGSNWRASCFDCSFTPPVATVNGPICEGSTLQLSATPIVGATYDWSGPNGFTSNQPSPTIANASAAASGTYTVTATVNGCTSVPVTVGATVYSTPATPSASNNGPFCEGQTLNLTASNVIGAIYSWSGPDGFSSSSQNPSLSGITVDQAGTYYVSAIINGCSSAQGTTAVTIQAAPAQPGSITGSTSECITTQGVAYSISSVSGADSYTWTVPSGSTVATGQSTTSITVNFGSVEGDICVTASNECGASSPACLGVDLIGAGGSNSQTFSYTGSIETFTVPNCVSLITIEAWGAQGGSRGGGVGGLGARMRGDFTVTPGQSLKVVVGEQPSQVCCGSSGAGGGGGSFVWIDGQTTEPLIAAGGGGGAESSGSQAGYPGLTTTSGGSAISPGGTGGTNGFGGGSRNSWYDGAGGAGWKGNGQNSSCGSPQVEGGRSLPTFAGGVDWCGGGGTSNRGGFGGGGAFHHGGGGGGGYSGGGGGSNDNDAPGGGGGSYNAGANTSNSQGVRSGHGQVVISW